MARAQFLNGLERMQRRLNRLAAVPRAVTTVAMSIIEVHVPVYTGTYRDAIRWDTSNPLDCAIYVSERSLLESAGKHAANIAAMAIPTDLSPEQYITGGVHPAHPPVPYALHPYEELYPLRIERTGAPKTYDGAQMWLMAEGEARKELREQLRRIA
jgi:hypothetical protein